MILAGYETTANTLAFAIYNLARQPDKAAKLCAEIDAHPGNPDYQSLEKLTYTDAVLRESLRLFPPGAIGLREASKDQIIGGTKLCCVALCHCFEDVTDRPMNLPTSCPELAWPCFVAA